MPILQQQAMATLDRLQAQGWQPTASAAGATGVRDLRRPAHPPRGTHARPFLVDNLVCLCVDACVLSCLRACMRAYQVGPPAQHIKALEAYEAEMRACLINK